MKETTQRNKLWTRWRTLPTLLESAATKALAVGISSPSGMKCDEYDLLYSVLKDLYPLYFNEVLASGLEIWQLKQKELNNLVTEENNAKLAFFPERSKKYKDNPEAASILIERNPNHKGH